MYEELRAELEPNITPELAQNQKERPRIERKFNNTYVNGARVVLQDNCPRCGILFRVEDKECVCGWNYRMPEKERLRQYWARKLKICSLSGLFA